MKSVSIKIAVFGFLFAACGGGAGGGSSKPLKILSTNLLPGSVWPINQAIEIRFDKPLDLASANLSSVSITPAPSAQIGAPAAPPVQGIFFLGAEGGGNALHFQPACPSNPGNQDGGFVPGNQFGAVVYSLTVHGGASPAGSLLRGADGSTLAAPFTVSFQTPVDHPFLDPVPQNPPLPAEPSSLPSTLGLNLSICPNDPLSILLDQPVLASSVDGGSVRLEFTHPVSGQTVPIPAQVILSENCTAQAQSRLTVIALGVLPPGQSVRAFLSKNLSGLGEGDRHPEDLLLFTAAVSGVPAQGQSDAFLEEFGDANAADVFSPEPLPLASWENGKLLPAPLFPGPGNDIEIEIGPGSMNPGNVSFSTSLGFLRDTSGIQHSFPGGVIEVASLKIKTPGAGQNSSLKGFGPNPLVIRAWKSIEIQTGAKIDVDGQNAPELGGLGVPNLPAAPGSGNCGGGSGGASSPMTGQSDAKGADANGPFEAPGAGGQGGHSGYGSPNNPANNRSGGGGGGNWNIREFDAAGNLVAFCYSAAICTIPDCELPNASCADTNCNGLNAIPPTNGEDGGSGVAASLDAFFGTAPAKGGKKGAPIFQDGDADNDFFGRKPAPGGGVRIGEMNSLLGGQGGGGGGDNVYSSLFPSPAFQSTDFRGGPGGGGAGVLVLQSLGPITIRGQVSANGGAGNRGEEIAASTLVGGGGGGGSGGMIVIESASNLTLGSASQILARGGQRGLAAGPHPLAPPGCTWGEFCRNNCTAGHGGSGGKGLAQIRVPFSMTQTVSCGGGAELVASILPGALFVETASGSSQIFCERDPLLSARFNPNRPHVLVGEFGLNSAIRSDWYYTGWAELASAPQFSFSGADAAGVLCPLAETVLASGAGGTVLSSSQVLLESAALADAVLSAPETLVRDGFRPAAGDPLLEIASASVEQDRVTLSLSASGPGIASLGTWQVIRRSYGPLSAGAPGAFPEGTTVSVQFEGADESEPGAMTPNLSSGSLAGPTADLQSLAGKKFLRFLVRFERVPMGSTPNPALAQPGLEFLKIGVRF